MDGSGKSVEECMRRLSRVVCGDMDVLNPDEIKAMAEYIYSEQVSRISEALLEVSERNNISKVVTTGLGMDILGARVFELSSLEYIGMDKLLNKKDCVVAPAVGTAILMEQFIINNKIN
jgi:hypothetical protein